jgi:hypothetical protein
MCQTDFQADFIPYTFVYETFEQKDLLKKKRRIMRGIPIFL